MKFNLVKTPAESVPVVAAAPAPVAPVPAAPAPVNPESPAPEPAVTAKRGRGRPPGAKNLTPAAPEKAAGAKRGRGRPPGAKNKVPGAVAVKPAGVPKSRGRPPGAKNKATLAKAPEAKKAQAPVPASGIPETFDVVAMVRKVFKSYVPITRTTGSISRKEFTTKAKQLFDLVNIYKLCVLVNDNDKTVSVAG